VVAYAREVLGDPEYLVASIAAGKERDKARSARYGNFYATEIDGLTIGEIHFYIHKQTRRMLIGLEGGKDYRAWRIEYVERTCEGIGFDS
jgi:hypothetical protein